VRQAADDGVPGRALGTTGAAPGIRCGDPAEDLGSSAESALPVGVKTELIEPAEGREVSGKEGSLRHVEVFWVAGVGTFIL